MNDSRRGYKPRHLLATFGSSSLWNCDAPWPILADQIREQLLPTTAAPKQDGSALLQFANVIFGLGIPESDTRMGA